MRPRKLNCLFRRSAAALALLVLLFTACVPAAATPTLPAPEPDWLEIHFTDPLDPNARYYEGGPDELLAAAIDAARLSVDIAAYNFNLWSIRDALVDAQRRGVSVRMVMESDNADVREVQDLRDAGIPVVTDQREGLMHNKFVVIDREEIWTGSMNFSTGGAYNDHNHLVRVRSTELAADYTAEFEDMYIQDRFGPDGLANTPQTRLMVNGTKVEVYFTPEDQAAERIIELIHGAQSSLHLMAYLVTSNEIGAAILEAAERGVTVSGVLDESQALSAQGSEYDVFVSNGLNVRLDGNEGLLHHKVIIIDESIVITGSYNFSRSAEERNDENVLILFDPSAAAQFLAEFQRQMARAKP